MFIVLVFRLVKRSGHVAKSGFVGDFSKTGCDIDCCIVVTHFFFFCLSIYNLFFYCIYRIDFFGFQFLTKAGNNSLYLTSQRLTWENAKTECEEFGGNLATSGVRNKTYRK